MSSNPFPILPVLIVDDEGPFLDALSFTLNGEGITNIVPCRDSGEVMALLGKREFSLVLLDLFMPGLAGTDLLPLIIRDHPEIPVIIITAANEVETAVECMKNGAYDYLVKPVDDVRLMASIRRAVSLAETRRENSLLKEYLLKDKLERPEVFSALVTRSKAMRAIFQYIEAIARTVLPVLITGETGTGKELIARAVHQTSGRKGEFVAVNVAGLDDHFFSDTLMGHRRGAFTGADRDRKGMIEQAAGGTLFLDEIGDLGPESQVKLLRVIEERKYYPLGSDVPRSVDARIVVATHQEIEALRGGEKFRRDLFFRLRTHHIHLPPLRERKEDIPLLVGHFLEKAGGLVGKKRITPPRELFTLLAAYDFPGNVRELEGMVYDAVSRHKSGVLSLASFREKIGFPGRDGDESPGAADSSNAEIIFPQRLPALKKVEEILIREALQRAEGNQTIAAQSLGLSRRALNNRLRRKSSKQF